MTGHEHDHERLDRAVEGAGAKFAGRILTPSLLGAVLLLGGFAVRTITGSIDKVAAAQAATSRKVEQVQAAQAEARADLRVVNTKLDEAVIRRLGDLERRVEVLENHARR